MRRIILPTWHNDYELPMTTVLGILDVQTRADGMGSIPR